MFLTEKEKCYFFPTRKSLSPFFWYDWWQEKKENRKQTIRNDYCFQQNKWIDWLMRKNMFFLSILDIFIFFHGFNHREKPRKKQQSQRIHWMINDGGLSGRFDVYLNDDFIVIKYENHHHHSGSHWWCSPVGKQFSKEKNIRVKFFLSFWRIISHFHFLNVTFFMSK